MKIIFEIMNIIRPAKTMNYKKVLPFNPNARGIPIPVLSSNESCLSCKSCEQVCPTHSLKIHSKDKMSFDYGACLQCGRCSEFCSDKKIIDSGFVHVYSTDREALKVTYTNGMPDEKPEMETEEVKRFRKTTKKPDFSLGRSLLAEIIRPKRKSTQVLTPFLIVRRVRFESSLPQSMLMHLSIQGLWDRTWKSRLIRLGKRCLLQKLLWLAVRKRFQVGFSNLVNFRKNLTCSLEEILLVRM
ncbi:4Fe-4S dicluster domain protein [Leptospira borgpetersenii str. Noumea 25]|uniref:4Fe-4S dicluster domain protein n=1 Tax=Leptospira borgpetersenii str. 200701203 TaxID=1193007 RepID=M3HRJ4_LEPBO|nr:4Fe-4S dicluster domain protein [Leptospira borgpetersenii str. 200701203]EMO12026.1 4Fe-4S dicluster domain protein [Leptospira borgpetersenii str. Noumea 25]